MQPFSSNMIIADKNHFVYSLFVKNVPYLSIWNKNVFSGKGAISKKQGIVTVLIHSSKAAIAFCKLRMRVFQYNQQLPVHCSGPSPMVRSDSCSCFMLAAPFAMKIAVMTKVFSFRHNRYHSPQTSRSHDVIGRIKPSFTSYLPQGRFFRIPQAPAGNCLFDWPTTSAIGSRALPW